MKRIVIFFFAASVVLGLCGCGTTAKFVYPARMEGLVRVASAPVYDKTVAVLPFDDFRKDENSFAPILLYYLPLMPFGWLDYNRPDAARMFLTVQEFMFTPSEDLPKAAAVSLRRSNLFKDAYFTFGGEKDRADFVFCGTIKTARYQGYMLSYGLSLYGAWLWFIGAPVGISENYLELEFALKKKNRTVWEYTFRRSKSIWQWLYYRLGHDVRGYSELMQEAMNEAIADLAARLRDNPKLLE